MKKEKRIFALGFFDGVHLGHQALLRKHAQLASSLGWQLAAITFDRHPQSLFTDNPPPLINSTQDREKLLRRYGVEHIYTLPVTKEVMGQSWLDFLQNLLEEGAQGFVCGQDFRFGHKGEGTAENVFNFCMNRRMVGSIVPDQTIDGIRVSSTHIRQLIEKGEMEKAVAFLGHPHVFSGQVVSGRQLGRTIGIPTANILPPEGLIVPKFGVYACMAEVDGVKHPAVTNIGTRPTVGGHRITVEPWLLDFEGDLYGKHITLEFYTFLRPEKKFPSMEALRTAIDADATNTRLFFKKLSTTAPPCLR